MRGERPNSPIATTQRFFQQSALVHVLEQRRETAIELRAMQVLQRSEIRGVRVPGVDFRIAVGDRRPVHLHEPGAGFDQSPRHQQALPERGHAVALAHLVRFLGEIEGVARLAGQHEIEGLAVILVDRLVVQRLLEIAHRSVDALQQLEPVLQTDLAEHPCAARDRRA